MELKIFQSTLKFLAILGITPQSRAFNLRNLMIILITCIMIIIMFAYLFFEASTFKEYTESIYMCSVGLAITFSFLSIIWKKVHIFQFVDKWEKVAETSMFYSNFVFN